MPGLPIQGSYKNLNLNPFTSPPVNKRNAKAVAKKLPEINIDETFEPEAKDKVKRRGRKRERDDVYFDTGYKKIEDIKAKLATARVDGMPVVER